MVNSREAHRKEGAKEKKTGRNDEAGISQDPKVRERARTHWLFLRYSIDDGLYRSRISFRTEHR